MVTTRMAAGAGGRSRALHALYPEAGEKPLEGLYLRHHLNRCRRTDGVYVYANFIASLDGRIAVANGRSGEMAIPRETANSRDWRLLLELAVRADALIISGRYVVRLAEGKRQGTMPLQDDPPADLVAFREALGCRPCCTAYATYGSRAASFVPHHRAARARWRRLRDHRARGTIGAPLRLPARRLVSGPRGAGRRRRTASSL